MTAPLLNPHFRRLWLANLLSQIGAQAGRVALILYVFNQGADVVNLALLVALDSLPGVLIGPIAGPLIDGYSRLKAMIVADLVRGLAVLAVLLNPSLGVIYLVAAVNSIAGAFFLPARAAAIPTVVKRSEVTRANGADQTAQNVAYVAGPMLGAYLLVLIGLPSILILDAASYLISVILIAGVAAPPNWTTHSSWSVSQLLKGTMEGWTYVIRQRLARHLAALIFVAAICTGMWAPLAPLFIRDYLGGSEQVLGWQLGLFGLGAALGGLAAPRLARRVGNGPLVSFAMICEAGVMIVYSLIPEISLSGTVILIWGVVVSLIVVPFYSLLQINVTEEFLGRVMTVVKQLESSATVIAMLSAILMVKYFDTQIALLCGGITYLLAVIAATVSQDGKHLLGTR